MSSSSSSDSSDTDSSSSNSSDDARRVPESVYLDAEIFTSLDESLRCMVCLNVPLEPHELKCGHLGCASCIKQALAVRPPRCPTCREPGSHISASHSSAARVAASQVKCPYAHLGCRETPTIGKKGATLAAHEAACQFSFVVCKQCNQEIMRNRVAEHDAKECEQRQVVCKHCKTAMSYHKRKTVHRYSKEQREAGMPRCRGLWPCPYGCTAGDSGGKPLFLPQAALREHCVSCPRSQFMCTHCQLAVPRNMAALSEHLASSTHALAVALRPVPPSVLPDIVVHVEHDASQGGAVSRVTVHQFPEPFSRCSFAIGPDAEDSTKLVLTVTLAPASLGDMVLSIGDRFVSKRRVNWRHRFLQHLRPQQRQFKQDILEQLHVYMPGDSAIVCGLSFAPDAQLPYAPTWLKLPPLQLPFALSRDELKRDARFRDLAPAFGLAPFTAEELKQDKEDEESAAGASAAAGSASAGSAGAAGAGAGSGSGSSSAAAPAAAAKRGTKRPREEKQKEEKKRSAEPAAESKSAAAASRAPPPTEPRVRRERAQRDAEVEAAISRSVGQAAAAAARELERERERELQHSDLVAAQPQRKRRRRSGPEEA